MRNSIEKALKEKKRLVVDGAMATELEAMGCDLNDELWSAKVLAEQPELIKKVHLSYFEAGADCGITASYQATIPGFMKRGYTEEESENLIVQAVRILQQAREQWWSDESNREGRIYPLVCGAVGPYGAYLSDGSEYKGGYAIGKAELKTFHKRRMEVLWEAGSDILAVETVPSLEEAVALAEIAEEIGAECWICFSCKDDKTISEGTAISECAKTLSKFDCIKAIGINCTAPQYVESLIKEVKQSTEIPIIVYPNSGEQYDAVSKTWSGSADGKTYYDWAKDWFHAGADIVGGCCRTSPKDIREVYKLLRE